MARPSIAALVLLAVAAPAHAVDLPSERMSPHAPADVVFTNDGGLVFLVETGPTVRTVYRLAPSASAPQSLMQFDHPRSSSTGSTLQSWIAAAGPGSGFLLSKYLQGRVGRCCFAGRSQTSITYYPVAGEPGIVLRQCQMTCGSGYSCGPGDEALPPADGSSVVLGSHTPACPDLERPTRVVHDLATGAETEVSTAPLDVWQIAGRYLLGTNYSASYPTARVLDWTTGESVVTVPALYRGALLPDGSLLYTDGWGPTEPVMSIAPGDGAPAPTGATGVVLAAAGERLLTASDGDYYPRTLRVWDGGTLIGQLDDVRRPAAFDGARLAFVDQSCLTARPQIWVVGAAAPEWLPPSCGHPRPTGPARLSKRTARMALKCPAATAQGCMGTVAMQRPHSGPSRRFKLRPGRATSAVLTADLTKGLCRRLRDARTWKLRITVPTPDGEESRSVTVRHSGTCQR
jgi:hypothetical protein